jgi:hypothetical protein
VQDLEVEVAPGNISAKQHLNVFILDKAASEVEGLDTSQVTVEQGTSGQVADDQLQPGCCDVFSLQ